jgi:hypothetical protein
LVDGQNHEILKPAISGMTIGIFKEWLVKYFFVHKIVFKAILVFYYILDYLATFVVSKMASSVFV